MRIPRPLGTVAEPLLHGLDDVVEAEAPLEMLFGREADLGVDDAVGREILGALARDARECTGRLHHTDGVRERLQVQQEVLPVRAVRHPGAGAPRDRGSGGRVPRLLGERHDRLGPESAVEVVVEQDLRGSTDLLKRWWHDRPS